MAVFSSTIKQGIAELVFDHPPVNAFDSKGWFSIAEELHALGQNAAVKVIVIRATGKGFCAGVDIKELAADSNRIITVNKGNYATFAAVHKNPKPVIVALHGFVLGGGIGIAGAADIIVASTCTRFGVPEIDRGALGGGAHLQRLFPLQKVRYMYFSGEFIDAAEAYRLGAIERIVEKSALRGAALSIAEKIATKSPAMIKLAKEALNHIEDGNLEDRYRFEQGLTLEAYRLADSAEAREAFVGRRDADFGNS